MQIKATLDSRIKMTDLEKLPFFRGIHSELSKFGKADCKPHSIPSEMDIKKTSDEVYLIDSKSYREIIGNLIYIMVATRLDICYAVSRLFQDRAKPNYFH